MTPHCPQDQGCSNVPAHCIGDRCRPHFGERGLMFWHVVDDCECLCENCVGVRESLPVVCDDKAVHDAHLPTCGYCNNAPIPCWRCGTPTLLRLENIDFRPECAECQMRAGRIIPLIGGLNA